MKRSQYLPAPKAPVFFSIVNKKPRQSAGAKRTKNDLERLVLGLQGVRPNHSIAETV